MYALREVLAQAHEAVKKVVVSRLKLFSEGKAFVPEEVR
jgi:hypothetical protein